MPDATSTSNIQKNAAAAYRPDIDGLRAIAVLSVLAFHAFGEYVAGGFIGVDIFFVISGYLITSILLNDLQCGQFSLGRFYGRRIRRIYPALLLVLLACLVMGWQVLLAGEYAELGQLVAAGAGFIANLMLWLQSGYFDTHADAKPLLHLWSLGIEEQFYIFWPIGLWLVHRAGSHGARGGRLALVARVATMLLLISFVWNIACVASDPVGTFYLPQTRVWELLVGGWLAIRLIIKGFEAPTEQLISRTIGRPIARPIDPLNNGKFKNLAACLGLGLLLTGASLVDKNSQFPGWWAALPTLGTALLIASDTAWINRKVLSHPLMVGIGLISYPLYLWHWPLLSFGRIIHNGEMPAAERLALMAVAFLLSYATYRLFEQKLRHGGRKITTTLFVAICLVGLTGWNIHQREGLDFRYRNLVTQPAQMVRDFTRWEDKGMYPVGQCDPSFVYPKANICLQSSPGQPPDTVVFGDSHAFHAYWGIARATGFQSGSGSGSGGHNVTLIGRGGCDFGLYEAGDSCEQTFQRQQEWMVHSKNIKNVFIAHRLVMRRETLAPQLANYQNRIGTLIGTLIASGKNVIYLYPVPEIRSNPQLCGSTLPFGRAADQSACTFALARELEIQQTERALVSTWLKQYPALQTFDPASVLCPDAVCQTIRNGLPLWMDDNHITESASYLLGDAIARSIQLR